MGSGVQSAKKFLVFLVTMIVFNIVLLHFWANGTNNPPPSPPPIRIGLVTTAPTSPPVPSSPVPLPSSDEEPTASAGGGAGAGAAEGSTKGLLYFRPRLAGFNNNMQELMCAAFIAKEWGRCLVLPHFAERIVWTHNTYNDLHPFTDYLSADSLHKGIGCVVSTEEFLTRCNRTVQLDLYPKVKLGRANKAQFQPVNPQYERFMNITAYTDAPKVLFANFSHYIDPAKRRAGPPKGMVSYKRLHETECLGLNWPSKSGAEVVLGIKKVYGEPGLSQAFERNEHYRHLRTVIQFAPLLSRLAEEYTESLTPGSFIAVHLRLGDFETWCLTKPDPKRCPGWPVTYSNISHVARLYGVDKVFIAVDPASRPKAQRHLTVQQQKALEEGGEGALNLTFHFMPDTGEIGKLRTDGRGIVEQLVCVRSVAFLGNFYSSWSHVVHELRLEFGHGCRSLLFLGWKFDSCKFPFSTTARTVEEESANARSLLVKGGKQGTS